MAALCAVLIFDITRRIFSRNAAIIAAVAASVLPSLIVWSIATLKETLVFFAALVALRTLQHLTTASRTDRHLGDAIVLLAAALGLLLYLRSSVVLIFLALLGVVIVARAHVRLERWQVALTAATIVAAFVGGLVVIRIRTSDRPLTATVEDVALQIRHRRAQEAAGAASQLRPETDVLGATGSTLPAAEAASDAEPFSFVSDVLDPLGYALFAPAPWQAESPMEFGASAEMPVWYVFVFASLLAWRAAPRQRLFVVCLVGYGIANWLILAAVEGNLGNLMRHRLMLDPMLLILGAAGLDWLWRRRSAIQKAKLPDHQYAYANHEGSPNRE
jgi:4-amino-4-deoxy-L-arabinose transferase-like glycosyltransferase